MDGIEKMLKSQQLTFGFVGVAPSMLVLALVGRWARGFVRTDGGKTKGREMKKRGWLTLRCVFFPLTSYLASMLTRDGY
jgi:nuclear-control-of-ATPase protein 2